MTCVCVSVCGTHLCPTLCCPTDCSPSGSSVHGILKNTQVGCHALLQGIFLTQGLNLALLHCKQILYQLSHREALVIYRDIQIHREL